ncbi:MAG: hypothetical protein NT167_22480, partial [Verrucomicrobia bacterium]|nr:hypothetical protein [Verrucomicrobiota bacterium]
MLRYNRATCVISATNVKEIPWAMSDACAEEEEQMKFWAGGVLILCLLLTSGCGGGAGSQGPTIQVSDA